MIHIEKGDDSIITKIKEFRTQRNIKQKELADSVGVTSRIIISIENGKYNPSLMPAYKLAVYFDVSIEELCCPEQNLEEERKNENI